MIKEEIKKKYKNNRFLLVGLSKLTGFSCASLLSELSIYYDVFDQRSSFEVKKTLDGLNYGHIFSDINEVDLGMYNFILLSPGFPRSHDLIQKAYQCDVPVYGDVDFIYPFLKDKTTIAVTGTDGKSTMVILLEKILSKRYKVVSCGNNEKPIFNQINFIEHAEIVIVELSSYMLEEHKNIKPSYSFITNIAEDHLDRYHSFSHYMETKLSLLKYLDKNNTFFWNVNDYYLNKIQWIKDKDFNTVILDQEKEKNFYFFKKKFFYRDNKKIAFDDIQLFGTHNISNIFMAINIADHLGVSFNDIQLSLKNIKPLPHRMELVKTRKNIMVINDSKSSTLQSTEKAIESFSDRIVLLLGGQGKKINYMPLNKYKNRIKKVFSYGEEGRKIQKDLNKMLVVYEKDFVKVVKLIWKELEKGDVFLLSPGCTSFDQFNGYAQRGMAFKEIIRVLDKNEDI